MYGMNNKRKIAPSSLENWPLPMPTRLTTSVATIMKTRSRVIMTLLSFIGRIIAETPTIKPRFTISEPIATPIARSGFPFKIDEAEIRTSGMLKSKATKTMLTATLLVRNTRAVCEIASVVFSEPLLIKYSAATITTKSIAMLPSTMEKSLQVIPFPRRITAFHELPCPGQLAARVLAEPEFLSLSEPVKQRLVSPIQRRVRVVFFHARHSLLHALNHFV